MTCCSHPHFRRTLALLAIVILCSACTTGAAAAEAAGQSLWLIDTRCTPQCGDIESHDARINFWQWSDDDCWSAREAQQFQTAKESSIPLVVFIHGNLTDADTASALGFCVYRTLQTAADGRSFRCAIWSWPSDRDCRRLRPDAQLKMSYCDAESYYLAQQLTALQPETPVCLVGHSFGARIITGALQLLAGGSLAGRTLPAAEQAQQRRPVRAMLLAAAVNSGALAAGQRNGRALAAVDQMLVTQNCCDRVLRFYPRICGRGGPAAMGAVGPALTDDAQKVAVVNASGWVGKFHDVRGYITACGFRRRLSQYAFFAAAADETSQPHP